RGKGRREQRYRFNGCPEAELGSEEVCSDGEAQKTCSSAPKPEAHGGMRTVPSPIDAMEARSVDAIPVGSEWQYEPKWDGFRCLLARDGAAIMLRSKSGEDLTRYFPELVDAARMLRTPRFTVDGEIVVPGGRTFSFDDLLQRIHP